jgi:hypothetical protein
MVSITVSSFFLRPFFQILLRLASLVENGARSQLTRYLLFEQLGSFAHLHDGRAGVRNSSQLQLSFHNENCCYDAGVLI